MNKEPYIFIFLWFPQIKYKILHVLSGASCIPLWTRLTAIMLLYLLNRNLPSWHLFILIWSLKPTFGEGFLFQPMVLRYLKIAMILLATRPISFPIFPPHWPVMSSSYIPFEWNGLISHVHCIPFVYLSFFVLFVLYYTISLIMVLWYVLKFVKISSLLLLLYKSCFDFSPLYQDVV